MYSMLVVDDDYLVRMGLRETVDWASRSIQITGDAANGREALQKALALRPDIILTDVKMPVMDGLTLLKEVKKAGVDCEIIILSGYEEFDYVREALHSGAFAYLLKPIDNRQLTETVSRAVEKLAERRRTMQYYEQLSSELSSAKKQFLRDIFSGEIMSDEELAKKIGFYNIELLPGRCYAIHISIDSFDEYIREKTREEICSLKCDITDSITERLGEAGQVSGICVDTSDNTFIAVMNVKSEGDAVAFLRRQIKEAAAGFSETYGVSFSIGISEAIEEVGALCTACASARRAAENKVIYGINSVSFIHDVETACYKREIQEALKYIAQNYASDVTVEMVAKELYISAGYLMHLFKDELGKTFNECLTEHRINVAKELLTTTKSKVYEVSCQVGYKDVKYFSQIFKKITGRTPSEYAKTAGS